jgi:DNA-binding NarL/FixJ family response regulator
VIVADDSALFRSGLVRVLESGGFEVVGQAGSAEEVHQLVATHLPELVILDIRMPPTQTSEGLVAAKQLRMQYSELGVLLLSHHVEIHHAMELLSQDPGRVGYLLKDRVADENEFLEAARRVGSGGSAIDPLVVSRLIGQKRARGLVDELTAREKMVLARMAEGRSNDAISAELSISPKTLETHIGTIYSKLRLEPSAADHRRVLAVLSYLQQA